MCVNLSDRGHTEGAYVKIWPSLGDKFRSNPQLWTFPTADIDGVNKSWKFERANFSGSGDIEGRMPLHNCRQADFQNFRRYFHIPIAGHAKELIYASAPHILYLLSWTLVSWKIHSK